MCFYVFFHYILTFIVLPCIIYNFHNLKYNKLLHLVKYY
jgi:hypothetical protein